MPVVVDASIALAWCFDDEGSAVADKVLDRIQDDVVIVPALWWLEIGNAFLTAEQRGRVTVAATTEAMSFLTRLPIETDGEYGHRVMERAQGLARVHALTVYDASYLELALRRAAPLATVDKNLHKAAQQIGVAGIED